VAIDRTDPPRHETKARFHQSWNGRRCVTDLFVGPAAGIDDLSRCTTGKSALPEVQPSSARREAVSSKKLDEATARMICLLV
jgi:hypothetical protein